MDFLDNTDGNISYRNNRIYWKSSFDPIKYGFESIDDQEVSFIKYYGDLNDPNCLKTHLRRISNNKWIITVSIGNKVKSNEKVDDSKINTSIKKYVRIDKIKNILSE